MPRILGFFVIATAAFLPLFISAWTGPSASPPNGNVAAPINVGANAQVKNGDFSVLGNIGAGTAAPAAKLDVLGWIRVQNTWGTNDNIGINGNQMWNTSSGNAVYLQWSNPGGPVIVGGQGSATNQLTVYGPIWARDTINAPSLCINSDCRTSWASISGVGGSGSANYVPRFTDSTTLGNSTLASDGASATANGNFFVTAALNVCTANSTGCYLRFSDDGYIQDNNDGYLRFNGNYIYNSNVKVGNATLQTDGNLYMPWLGDWISNRLNQDVRTNASPTFNDTYANNWFRVNGGGGIYWQQYGGGWYMSDATWLRAYNNKNVYTAGQMRADGGFCIGGSCITSWTAGTIGGSGSTNYMPRFTGATTLGNSSITSDGASATANGNFFVTGTNYQNGLSVVSNTGAKWFGLEPEQSESPAHGSIVNWGTVRLIQFNLDAPYTAAFAGPITTGSYISSGDVAINRNYLYLAGYGDTNHAIHNVSASDSEEFRFFNYLDLYSSAGGQNVMRLQSNGNIGIGMTNPAQKLDVNGYVQIESTNGEGGTIKLMGNNGVNMHLENINGTFRLVNSPWTAQVFTVDQSGNTVAGGSVTATQYCIGASCITSWPSAGVGGTGTPGKLPRYTAGTTLGDSSISSDGTSATASGNFFTGSLIVQGGGSWAPGAIYTDSNWGMLFRAAQTAPAIAQFAWYNGAANTEFMRISTNGNVGVGTSNPGYKLDVNGAVNGTQICINGTCRSSWPSLGSSFVYGWGNSGITSCPAGAVMTGQSSWQQMQCDGNGVCTYVTYYSPVCAYFQ